MKVYLSYLGIKQRDYRKLNGVPGYKIDRIEGGFQVLTKWNNKLLYARVGDLLIESEISFMMNRGVEVIVE